jgi:hypothetical protein
VDSHVSLEEGSSFADPQPSDGPMGGIGRMNAVPVSDRCSPACGWQVPR